MKTRPLGRLALRIYLVSLAQLVVIAAAVFAVGWFSWSFRRGPDFRRRALYVVDTVTAKGNDRVTLERELARVNDELGGKLTIYGPSNELIGTSSKPPLPSMSRAERQAIDDAGSVIRESGGPPKSVISLDARGMRGAYAIYTPPPPPHPPGPSQSTLVIAMIAAAIAAMLLARSLAPPLVQLTDVARRFGEGDLSARANSRRRDEIGVLANAFDEMAERVAHLVRSQQELLANVSHELRTPLARIHVALDLAAEGDAQMAREALSEIAEDLAELERLVADVLQTARFDLAASHARPAEPPIRRERLDVPSLIEKAAARFRTSYPERVLSVVVADVFPEVQADAVMLRRVIDNVLDNARKYSAVESVVTLSAEVASEQLVITIEDRGIGIAEKDLSLIATPFFRVDRSRTRSTGGLGLGLSLARAIALAHGGKLDIDSELAVGTKVRISIPIDAPSPSVS